MLSQHLLEKLEDPNAWYGMAIRHELPSIDRIWLRDGSDVTCLHRLYPLKDGQKPYFHKHPWECSTTIIHGGYYSNIGFSSGDQAPPVLGRLFLSAGSSYDMINPDLWHTVEPITETYTIFKIRKRFEISDTTKNVCGSRHIKLSHGAIDRLLTDVKLVLHNYGDIVGLGRVIDERLSEP